MMYGFLNHDRNYEYDQSRVLLKGTMLRFLGEIIKNGGYESQAEMEDDFYSIITSYELRALSVLTNSCIYALIGQLCCELEETNYLYTKAKSDEERHKIIFNAVREISDLSSLEIEVKERIYEESKGIIKESQEVLRE